MIDIRVFNAHPTYRTSITNTLKLARHVLFAEQRTNVQCSIVYINDRRMRELNQRYLHKHRTTDVLTFPLHQEGARGIAGEVYISLDQARRQAKYYKATAKSETARLVIHGVLHLIGYEDRTKRQKTRMKKLEDRYLLNYG